jgi:hypothetical protein
LNKGKFVTEKELVEKMYEKHQKWVLDAKEAPKEWGRSYSHVSKLFGGKDSIPDSIILAKQIIPPWVMYGTRRMWKITDIAHWIINTEKTNKS